MTPYFNIDASSTDRRPSTPQGLQGYSIQMPFNPTHLTNGFQQDRSPLPLARNAVNMHPQRSHGNVHASVQAPRQETGYCGPSPSPYGYFLRENAHPSMQHNVNLQHLLERKAHLARAFRETQFALDVKRIKSCETELFWIRGMLEQRESELARLEKAIMERERRVYQCEQDQVLAVQMMKAKLEEANKLTAIVEQKKHELAHFENLLAQREKDSKDCIAPGGDLFTASTSRSPLDVDGIRNSTEPVTGAEPTFVLPITHEVVNNAGVEQHVSSGASNLDESEFDSSSEIDKEGLEEEEAFQENTTESEDFNHIDDELDDLEGDKEEEEENALESEGFDHIDDLGDLEEEENDVGNPEGCDDEQFELVDGCGSEHNGAVSDGSSDARDSKDRRAYVEDCSDWEEVDY
ncbi:hypothetical protein BJ508DRAFT_372699 [Ascobolus immersus RN42]|uniref:Uncharacterized protein n=1 Tax=Ascobolus immersus RN42 TaxID=1160509 RepID=A0A3N4IQD9_ASCIM|nr:hypothetical protein BJ508DRAFT_372699 [Ascobolus immersus RN42]